jgi:hypothetical protein
MPGPPGSGVTSPARRNRTRSAIRCVSSSRPSMSEIRRGTYPPVDTKGRQYSEEFLTIRRDGTTILAIQSGDMVLGPTRDDDRQYALDLLFNALAAVTFLIPPYSTETTSISQDQTVAHAKPDVGRDLRAFRPYQCLEV